MASGVPYEARLDEVATSFDAFKGKIGEVVECAGGKIVITSQSGRIHVSKTKLGDGKKVNGDALGITVGTMLGNRVKLRMKRADQAALFISVSA